MFLIKIWKVGRGEGGGGGREGMEKQCGSSYHIPVVSDAHLCLQIILR